MTGLLNRLDFKRRTSSKKFIGGFIDKLKEKASDLWDSLWNDEHLPTRFQKFVKAHGDEKITRHNN